MLLLFSSRPLGFTRRRALLAIYRTDTYFQWISSHNLSYLIPRYPKPPLSLTSSIRRRNYLAQIVFMSSSSIPQSLSFYDLHTTQPDGSQYDFSELKGKIVLVVNVASQCGFTPQYKGLQMLYDKYADKGLVILGFPCNQFGGQEPGTDADIAKFCELNHGGVKFPIMKKSDVNGSNANEVFKWLKSQKSGLMGLTRIKWNFEKFLVDKQGSVVHRWASTTTPEAIDKEIAKLVEL